MIVLPRRFLHRRCKRSSPNARPSAAARQWPCSGANAGFEIIGHGGPRAAAVYEAVSAAFGAARGEARARLLTAMQGRALELPWLMYELSRRLPLPPGIYDAVCGGSYEAVCSLLSPPPRRDQAAVLLLQVRLARCALAHRAWPAAAAAAALANACHRV